MEDTYSFKSLQLNIISMDNTSEILRQDFVNQYKNKVVPWGFNGLGYIVYKRTYSRTKLDGTQEEWYETIQRCINGAQKIGAQYTEEEAERLFDHIFNLRCNFAGRPLWQLGTSTVDRFGLASLLNCFFVSMRVQEDFCFVFEHLMLGGGVGYSVKREDIHELPRIKPKVNITHINTTDADFIVPDSRQGWVQLLRNVLCAYYNTGKSFTYSTILVRGLGEPIRGFGGTASGPMILIEGIDKIYTIFKSREGKKLRSIDVLDINNIIGSIVVAGNVRRCLPGEYLIATEDGPKPIKDVVAGDIVLNGSNNKQQVIANYDNGIQDVSKIITSQGNIYEATQAHRFMVYDTIKREVIWKTVRDIRPGVDKLLSPKIK